MKLARFDLSGKAAIVTGGCSGLGITFSEALAEAGSNIIIADVLVGTPQCQDVCSGIEKLGVKVLPVKCDVTNPEDVDNLITTTGREFDKIDILVNSAGIFGENKRVVDMSPENWDRVIAVDLRGSFLCCRAVAREMIKQNEGKIINISSASSFKALPGMAAYAAAKAAIIMLTKTLALELARYNIQVNTLSPGYFITPLNRDFFETEGGKKLISGWPMRRPGNVDELKGIIIQLASAASNYITGSEIPIDGGQWL
ncbi:MAG TPA: SDR family oxidoreductase [Dehalococcoidia bacterium]|nr:SDR family oxidoreductase [Dehalococcoidia bacterium]